MSGHEPGGLLGAVALVLAAQFVFAGAAGAQNRAAECDAAAAARSCDLARASCEQECRARMFAVDPSRSRCLSACEERSSTCWQAASARGPAQNCR